MNTISKTKKKAIFSTLLTRLIISKEINKFITETWLDIVANESEAFCLSTSYIIIDSLIKKSRSCSLVYFLKINLDMTPLSPLSNIYLEMDEEKDFSFVDS